MAFKLYGRRRDEAGATLLHENATLNAAFDGQVNQALMGGWVDVIIVDDSQTADPGARYTVVVASRHQSG